MKIKTRKKQAAVTYFNSAGFDSANFQESDDGNFAEKRALVLVEGTHIDSNKRTHTFDPERLVKIANNTNAFLSSGGRVPLQRDHKKDQGSNIGDLESLLTVRVITEEDLPNGKLRHLLGKLGIFADKVVAKGAKVVEEIRAKTLSTISPGIDVANDIIKEISATPTPAIIGPALFSEYADFGDGYGDSKALTMAEADIEHEDMDQYKEMFEEESEKFWCVVKNIRAATEEMLQGNDPYSLMEQAIADYSERIYQLLGMDEIPPDNDGSNPVGGTIDPNYIKRQQDIGRTNNAMYTMRDVQLAKFASAGYDQPRKKRGVVKTAAIGAAGVGGTVGAVRYGGAGVKLAREGRAMGGTGIGSMARNFRRGAASKVRADSFRSGRSLERAAESIGKRKFGRGAAGGVSRVANYLKRVGRRV